LNCRSLFHLTMHQKYPFVPREYVCILSTLYAMPAYDNNSCISMCVCV